MTRPWIYFINPFLVVTDGSYRKMKQLGDYTFTAIATAAETATDNEAKDFFTRLLTTLKPPVDTYDDAYTVWTTQQGLQKGQTRSLTDLLEDLRSTQIQDWDLAIQNVYRQNTPQYIALLPRHRAPFQSGSQQQRITAVGALSLAIGKDAKLQTLKETIDNVYDALVEANNSQKGSKSTKTGSSAELEADRTALATVLYGVLGLLMDYYQATPENIGQYFLMTILRDREQMEFTHALKGGETRLALTRTFEDDDMLRIADEGNTGLAVALVAAKNSPMPEDPYVIKNGDVALVSPGKLGAAGNRFLLVRNGSATEGGDYTITIE